MASNKSAFGKIDVFFLLVAFLLTRQFPLLQFFYIARVSLLLYFFWLLLPGKSYLYGRDWKLFVLSGIYIIILSLYSLLVQENDYLLVIRFSVALFLLLIAYFSQVSLKAIRLFIDFVVLQAIVLIVIEVLLALELMSISPSDFRFLVNNMDFGDVYSYNGFYYKIQLRGNALLPFAFTLVLFVNEVSNRRLIKLILLMLGIIAAGNLAFLLIAAFAISLKLLLFERRQNAFVRNVTALFLTLLLSMPIVSNFVSQSLERKADYSLAVRYDQINVLLDDLASGFGSIIYGRGLGNTIDVATQYRNYIGDIYYEFQLLYFINQLGLLNFLVFFVLHFYFSLRYIGRKDLLMIYLLYILYALSNPYFLDTNHVLVIAILVSLNKLSEYGRRNIGIV